ncbi:hypothetical protein [Rhodococcus sp. T7]|uniref:hypothetical protein n=1 Tax=Rhodococcus sp. T7 TaxID=627444 RepID=UPI00135C93F1|nr:hypothetical protein [Rhodococcus sp. T7]KAF0966420.1 hypothetical protein MLGJGCBP_00439 [Rhodococcus sp. T7]
MNVTPGAPSVPMRVLHNEARDAMLIGYTEGDPLREVSRFEMDPRRDLEANLEEVFEALNEPGPRLAQFDAVRRYRAERHRSLSKGDVLFYGELAYAVAGAGFVRVYPTRESITFR